MNIEKLVLANRLHAKIEHLKQTLSDFRNLRERQKDTSAFTIYCRNDGKEQPVSVVYGLDVEDCTEVLNHIEAVIVNKIAAVQKEFEEM